MIQFTLSTRLFTCDPSTEGVARSRCAEVENIGEKNPSTVSIGYLFGFHINVLTCKGFNPVVFVVDYVNKHYLDVILHFYDSRTRLNSHSFKKKLRVL